MKKKKKLSLLQKRALTGFAFITPWLIGFLWCKKPDPGSAV